MIKKIIACLTICFIITGIISPVFSDASALPQPNWSDPGISEIINISDLTGWMLNGGTFDVSTYTDAESFMNDYFNSRTQTRLVSPSEDPQDDYYEVLPGFGINNQLVAGESFARPLDTNRVIASSFRDHTGYGRRLSNEVNETLLSSGHLIDTKIPLLSDIEFANFVNYNHDALNLYTASFLSDLPDNPTPNPDPAYLTYLDYINKHDLLPNTQSYFWFWNSTDANGLSFYPTTDYTWVLNTGRTFQSYSYQSGGVIAFPIQTINILTNPNDNSHYYSFSGTGSQPAIEFTNYGYQDYGVRKYTDRWNISPTCSYSYAGSLADCLSHISNYFKNVNIYVDGEPWAIVSEPIIPTTITPEFPDAVGGEDLPTTTWPVYKPREPYYTNVPGMLQAIEDAIADDGKLDIDDLKPYLTDENGDPVPDPIFDPEPVPIPVPDPVNPDVVPGLPILPDIPPEMPGFNGVSVLAEIINFTNQSLPTALIVTFWSIVFGIVILGLIKILHK